MWTAPMSKEFEDFHESIGSENMFMFDSDLCLQIQGDASYQSSIQELLDAMDSYIPEPIAKGDQAFMMPVEDVFHSKAITQIYTWQN